MNVNMYLPDGTTIGVPPEKVETLLRKGWSLEESKSISSDDETSTEEKE